MAILRWEPVRDYYLVLGACFVAFLSLEEREGRAVGAVDVDHKRSESRATVHDAGLADWLGFVDIGLIWVLTLDKVCRKDISSQHRSI